MERRSFLKAAAAIPAAGLAEKLGLKRRGGITFGKAEYFIFCDELPGTPLAFRQASILLTGFSRGLCRTSIPSSWRLAPNCFDLAVKWWQLRLGVSAMGSIFGISDEPFSTACHLTASIYLNPEQEISGMCFRKV